LGTGRADFSECDFSFIDINSTVVQIWPGFRKVPSQMAEAATDIE
jgi:hypothetical protein